jgi:hypothetical protein
VGWIVACPSLLVILLLITLFFLFFFHHALSLSLGIGE